VPSTSGVADVFAFQNDGTVQAITSDGTVAWTADLGQRYYPGLGSPMPDFQGGLVVSDGGEIYKLDGITGQPYPAYLGSTCGVAVHPDGTVFAVEALNSGCESPGATVVGIDPITGAQKFSVTGPVHGVLPHDAGPGQIIIAGDGYAYFSYGSLLEPPDDLIGEPTTCYSSVLRIDSSGNYDVIPAFAAPCGTWPGGDGHAYVGRASMITNADQGILFTWDVGGFSEAPTPQMATITGGGLSLLSPPQLPGGGLVDPVLQAQDGSFVGTTCLGCPVGYGNIISFDAGGNVRWIVPNDTPQIATADGGVIGQSGITYDQAGNATGMIANMPTYSWTGSAYLDGPTTQVLAPPLYLALGFWSLFGGNNSGTGAAVNQQWFPPLASCTDNGGNCQGQPLGPRDFLWNAKQDLAGQLAHDQACMTAANTFVFNKVQYGGFLGFFKSPINGSQFDLYIQNTQLFYNGPKSTLDYAVAKCGIPRQFNCNGVDPPQTVGQQFDSNETALTVTPGMPLMSFWQPNFTPPATVNGTVENEGFGVGINPSNYGVNIFNESNLFHEALHGMTGLDDFTIQGDLMGSAQQGAPSVNISIFIKDNVLSQCPSFRGGQQ
jgi:hypothetical protein